ncbi:Uncharacterised protein [Raoultella terrigena]|uniref:Uncharacterized protein n=1 Tax=Raoultella terrigena TaxID=577 RepID=A0A4U9D2L5_RAOTE|nr:Uncharacterised protein [Raoultella terrigena]
MLASSHWTVQAQRGNPLFERRQLRHTHFRTRQDPGVHPRLRQIHHPPGVFFDLLLLLIFLHQGLYLARRLRYLIHRVNRPLCYTLPPTDCSAR